MKALHILVATLLIVGGLNWGLVGLFNFNLVSAIFGEGSLIARIIYMAVGAAAVGKIICLQKMHSCSCEKK